MRFEAKQFLTRTSRSRAAYRFLFALAVGLPCFAFGVGEVQAADFFVTASVTASFAPSEGPVSSATAKFSFFFNDDFLNGASAGSQGDFPVTSFSTSLNPVGSTFYDMNNTEGYVFYNQGSLRQILVGGVGPGVLDENSVDGKTDDIYVSLRLRPSGELDNTFGMPGNIVYATNGGEIATYEGVVTTGSVNVVVVPEPATMSVALVALFGFTAFAARRRS